MGLAAASAFGQCTLDATPTTCTLTGPVTVNSSYVNPDGNTTTTSGTIANNGAIQFNGTGSGTYMFLGANTTLNGNGSGTLTLANTANNGNTMIYGAGGTTLENVNNTIQGQGHIGDNFGISLQNDNGATVNANVNGQTLIVDPAAGTTNQGVLTATNGGSLQLGYTVNNAGGQITTDSGNGSQVNLSSVTVQGGTLNGNIQVTGSTTLDASTHGQIINSQNTTVQNGSSLNVTGTIQNNGAILLNGTGSGTYMFVAGSTILNGNGSVTLVNTANNGNTLIYGAGGTTLENVNNTIQGQGHIGDNFGIAFQNDMGGTVTANVNGQTLLVDAAGGTTNQGVLTATNGGILQLQSYTVNNAGGQITNDSGNGSQVSLSSVTVQGGTLNGNIQVTGSTTLDGSTHGQIINSQNITVQNGSTLSVPGTIQNNGAILLDGTGSGTYMYVAGNTILNGNGSGTLTLANSANNGNTMIYGAGGATLENVNNTIQGQGHIGGNFGIVFQNDNGATVNANVNGQTLHIDAAGGTTNAGIMTATGGGNLQLDSFVVTNTGTISTDSRNGSTVAINGATVNGGTVAGSLVTFGGAEIKNSTVTGSIQATGNTTLDFSSAGSLKNAPVTVANGATLSLAGTSAGAFQGNNITLNGAGSATYLYLQGSTTLGGGTLTLSNSANNGNTLIYGVGGSTLENASGNTIQGQGHLGDNYGISLQNDNGGTVNANVNGQTLLVDAAGGTTNQGVLTATNGGTLQLEFYNVNNAGGQITTDSGNGSQVNLSNVTVQGGTLNGNIQVIGSTTLDASTQGPVTNSQNVTVQNGSTLSVTGTIRNNGAILLNGAGSATYMFVAGNTILNGNGSGTLTMTNTANNGNTLIYGAGGATLENVNNTIQGQGHIGDTYGITVLNDAGGTIVANVSGQTLYVDAAGGLSNSGTLKATNGATLSVSAPLAAADFAGNTLQGGGSYVVNGTTGVSTMQISSLGTTGNEINTIGANTTLTLIGANSNVKLLDSSSLNAIDVSTNNGNLNLESGYNLAAAADTTFTNTGNVVVDGASTLTVSAGQEYLQTAGETQVDGALNANLVDIQGGILAGGNGVTSGSISGSVVDDCNGSSCGTVRAGDNLNVPVDPPGDLHVGLDYTQNSGASLIVDIGGAAASQTSQVNVGRNVFLNGNDDILTLALLDNYLPNVTGKYLFLTYNGTLNADAFVLSNANADPNGVFKVDYSQTGDIYLDFTANNVSAAPEPSFIYLIVGILGVLLFYRRRKQNQSRNAAE